VLLSKAATGLPRDSVAKALQIVAIDRAFLTRRAGKLPARKLAEILSGIDIILGK
jgi:mRNA-degrading endonuclease toxin of MazEF toxin-antitoxin module